MRATGRGPKSKGDQMLKRTMLLIVICVATTGSALAGNYGVRKNEIGIDGGIARSASGDDFKEGMDSAAVVGFHYMRFVTPHFGLGLQADYLWWDEHYYEFMYEPDGMGDY